MNRPSSRGVPWIRIIAEGLTIVASILLAFAIDAWWDGRQERVRERAYVRMLAADLRLTLENNATFSARADSVDWTVARLVRAYYEPELPPRDSLVMWSRSLGSWAVVQPTLNTARTLVQTGDLDLIRHTSLRAEIPRYLTAMIAFEGFEQTGADNFLRSSEELRDLVGGLLNTVQLGQLSADTRASRASSDDLYPFPGGPLRRVPSEDIAVLVRNEQVHRILWDMNVFKRNMRRWRSQMRTYSEDLLELVDAAMLE